MNVTLIECDIEEARNKLRAYRAKKHKDAEVEYARCEKLYREMANGRAIVNVTEAIVLGGRDSDGRPRIAIARADRKEVELQFSWDSVIFDSRCNPSKFTNHNEHLRHAIRWPGVQNRWEKFYAYVPMIPADVRPSVGQLKDWHILWEVDEWHSNSKFASVSSDPMLLKRIDEDFYAVIAVWDLTPLETSILNAIRGSEKR